MKSGATENVTLFYRPEYVVDVLGEGFRHTFDIHRPRRIRDALIEGGFAGPADFLSAQPLSEGQLALVHTPEYIDQIKNSATLASFLLLDPSHPWGDGLLDPFLLASGGTLAAARSALADGGIAVNLGGGFHHAQVDKAEGFCAVADVAIAIRQLRKDGMAGKVMVLDVDYHQGNGNTLIFEEDETVFTYSIHGANWCQVEKTNNLDVVLPHHVEDAEYLRLLAEDIPRILEEFRPELVFYVDGSDPFIEDTLGEADLTERGLFERDRFVTEQVRSRNVPMVVVTAGGYGTSSWRIYYNYFRWLLSGELPGNA